MNYLRLLFIYAFVATFWGIPLAEAQVTVSNYYKKDRDGDGVPDVRDQCPDTDINLNGQEFDVEFEGKKYTIRIGNLKKNFEIRRRRLLVEISRLDRERIQLLKPVKGNRDKMDKLPAEDQNRIQEIDTLEAGKRDQLINLVYEAKVTIDGKEQIIEVPIGVDEFGCLPDRDGDGVPDMVDKCPDDPGKRIYFGCNDRDGDGVLDHEDECPDEPGLKRLKGCPDRGLGDRDGDTVIDRDDLCPDTPGTVANKGCPELVSEEDKKIIEQASKVLFDSAKATLRPESNAILDRLAKLILDLAAKHENLKVRLEGHTDTDGSNEANLTLSRNRARAVKDYLVSKGVSLESISTAGYGEERLKVSPERSPADKQANRRVDIAITNQ